LIKLNDRQGGTYVEPYAGGAGAALSLLFAGHVKRIIINDADPRIYAFWDVVLNKTERFLKLLRETSLTVEEWERQRKIYRHPRSNSSLRVGFASFYLNRCNRSGIIARGGIIGGKQQLGKWKIDARFNRDELAERARRIAGQRDHIHIYNLDALEFLRDVVSQPRLAGRAFVYLDPPYFHKGSQLYLNHYSPADHANLAAFLKTSLPFKWVMSYDNVPEVRALYSAFRRVSFDLGYSARTFRVGRELLVFNEQLQMPAAWRRSIPSQFISAADTIPIAMPG
jgi:DNA adenine methylase